MVSFIAPRCTFSCPENPRRQGPLLAIPFTGSYETVLPGCVEVYSAVDLAYALLLTTSSVKTPALLGGPDVFN